MNCKEVTEFLADYFDRTLPRRRRWVFRLHLRLCRDCRRYLRSYATTVQLTRSLGSQVPADSEAAVPQELANAVMASLRQTIKQNESGRTHGPDS